MLKVFLIVATLYTGQSHVKSEVIEMPDYNACASKMVEIAEFTTKYKPELEYMSAQCVLQKP